VLSYVETLKSEIALLGRSLPEGVTLSRLHWGGGTPTMIPPAAMRDLARAVFDTVPLGKDAEFSVEIDPNEIDGERLDVLCESGMNRASIGVQDFDADIQQIIGRDQTYEVTRDTVEAIRARGVASLNADILFGLPKQNQARLADSVQKLLSLSPDRVALYGYAHVPWIKKAQKILETKGLPGAKEKLAMFTAGYEILSQNGYTPIGLDHYAKDHDELSIALKNRKLHRNFQGYCTRETTGQVYAFGATGISQLQSVYAQNRKDTEGYLKSISQGQFATEKGYHLNQTEKIIRHVITEIMCNEYVSFEETAGFFHLSEEEIISALKFEESLFEGFVNDGLLHIENGTNFTVSEIGRFFIRNIAAQFDPNLNRTNQRFSKAL